MIENITLSTSISELEHEVLSQENLSETHRSSLTEKTGVDINSEQALTGYWHAERIGFHRGMHFASYLLLQKIKTFAGMKDQVEIRIPDMSVKITKR